MATRPSSLTLYDRATPQERAMIRRACLSIPCRSCGAFIGQRCHGTSGKPAQPHEIRRRNALNPPQPTTDQRLAALEEQVATIRGFLNI